MLFRKKIQRSCQYCANGTMLEENQFLCSRRGMVFTTEGCRKFRYDPCKRIPSKPKALDFRKYDEHDFSL